MQEFENMETQGAEKVVEPKTDNIGFIVFRLVFVVLLALFILFARYFLPEHYKEIKHYYDNYISVNITADYYLAEDD